MSVSLQCCENKPVYEVEYEIGTTYLVCNDCLEKPHFQRGIKNKKEIGCAGKPRQSQTKTDKLTGDSVCC
ncbi:MAG: hypothetical protein OEW78_05155 [Nitrosopumilus sp.]|uniref:hypothetical protein n=1 Tax=Nitrosopumilus sp. TaxID=2024843 RepID=UPI00246F8FF4|nr:hypothetical protein [Nitrosopumilus sp.]MDH5431255.1 hypothetical protein [Nitrosopumilus sp.]